MRSSRVRILHQLFNLQVTKGIVVLETLNLFRYVLDNGLIFFFFLIHKFNNILQLVCTSMFFSFPFGKGRWFKLKICLIIFLKALKYAHAGYIQQFLLLPSTYNTFLHLLPMSHNLYTVISIQSCNMCPCQSITACIKYIFKKYIS